MGSHATFAIIYTYTLAKDLTLLTPHSFGATEFK